MNETSSQAEDQQSADPKTLEEAILQVQELELQLKEKATLLVLTVTDFNFVLSHLRETYMNYLLFVADVGVMALDGPNGVSSVGRGLVAKLQGESDEAHVRVVSRGLQALSHLERESSEGSERISGAKESRRLTLRMMGGR
jgi:hypothetical protein